MAAKTDEELLPVVRDGVKEKGAESEWDECVDILVEELAFAEGDSSESVRAEIVLSKALEWRGWAIVTSPTMRRYMKPKLPDSQQLRRSLDWLRGGPLLLSDVSLLTSAIEASPKAYLVDPETTYAKALSAAPDPYRDPTAFRMLLLDDPTALGNTYNCADDGCNSECGNCWVSYEIKKGGGGGGGGC